VASCATDVVIALAGRMTQHDCKTNYYED